MLPISRKEVADKIVEIILADINAPLRETAGKNRSPRIDSINKRAGAGMGDPYCASGGWCAVDDACKALGLKNPIKPTAWSQAFSEEEFIPLKYLKTSGSGPALKGYGVVFRSQHYANHGHYVTVSEDQTDGLLFKTVEYNTAPHDGSRDGDGAYALIRSKMSRSIENAGMIFVCFVDIPQFVIDHNFPG